MSRYKYSGELAEDCTRVNVAESATIMCQMKTRKEATPACHSPKLKIVDIKPSEMLRLMKTYGPERIGRWYIPKGEGGVLDSAPRTDKERGALRRKFARWFPSFAEHFFFCRATGTYQPIIGHDKEMTRREETRRMLRPILRKDFVATRKRKQAMSCQTVGLHPSNPRNICLLAELLQVQSNMKCGV